MGNLKFKSNENLAVAQMLVEKGYYNSSIHCSYYGCFQFMKSILCNRLSISYETQDSNKNSSTHEYIFGRLINKIKNVNNERRFKVAFNSLKDKRKKADYSNELISEDEGLTAIEEAKRVINYLEQEFGKLN